MFRAFKNRMQSSFESKSKTVVETVPLSGEDEAVKRRGGDTMKFSTGHGTKAKWLISRSRCVSSVSIIIEYLELQIG